jgi:Fur family ferric uptake transcriptional regulator
MDKNSKFTEKSILEAKSLRVTSCRIDMLTLFIDSTKALTHSDLEDSMGRTYDRVTLYRTLQAFTDSGILHKVPDDKGISKYALCHSGTCAHHIHLDNHIHFECNSCGETRCLDQLGIPPVALPAGYIPKEQIFLIKGTCNRCSSF